MFSELHIVKYRESRTECSETYEVMNENNTETLENIEIESLDEYVSQRAKKWHGFRRDCYS